MYHALINIKVEGIREMALYPLLTLSRKPKDIEIKNIIMDALRSKDEKQLFGFEEKKSFYKFHSTTVIIRIYLPSKDSRVREVYKEIKSALLGL
jgi:hypothetical protein